jgi:ParB-like chromosome segregation protein Spo0J
MRIERVAIDRLSPAKYNPRRDLQPGDAEYAAIATSLARWDLVEPLVWNEQTGNLVAGHQRLKILIARGDTEVDVSVVDLAPDEEAALNIALNKITGRWDESILAEVLAGLDAHGVDLSVTGFNAAELAALSAALAPPSAPVFTPAAPSMPGLDGHPVTVDEVAAAATRRDEQFRAKPAPPAIVACPSCGHEFGI